MNTGEVVFSSYAITCTVITPGLAFVTFPFLACCRRFYAYKVQIHPATIARYFEFNAVFFETFSLPVPSYPINKAFPWPVFLDFVP